MSPAYMVYLRLRQLELALALPGALENLRDVNGNALQFAIDVRDAIDNYERMYPEVKDIDVCGVAVQS
jgi:hypothetical protein